VPTGPIPAGAVAGAVAGDVAGAVAGIDLGGTKVLARAVDPLRPHDVLATARRATPRGAPAILDALVGVVADLRAGLGPDGPPLAAVGVGAAGLIDGDGALRVAPNLPGLIDVPLRRELEAALGVPVVVDNDANCAAWAEARAGAAIGAAEAVVVTLGTGIGAGLIVGGRLRRGAHGFAGEVGHMVVDPDGPPCPCGRRGCWERYASGSGLGRLARDVAEVRGASELLALAGGDPEAVRGEHVTAAAHHGDPVALEILRQFGWWVAVGLANLANLLDPEVAVIGGGLVEAGPLLLDPVRAAYHELLYGDEHRPAMRIVEARFGAEAGALGAALLAADRAGAEPAGGGWG
jgi:glucokinase